MARGGMHVQAEAQLRMIDVEGRTPLMLAAKHNVDGKITVHLCKAAGASKAELLLAADKQGFSAVHHAIQARNSVAISATCTLAGLPQADFIRLCKQRVAGGRTLVHMLVQSLADYKAILKRVLDLVGAPNLHEVLSVANDKGATPLMTAVHVSPVPRLVQYCQVSWWTAGVLAVHAIDIADVRSLSHACGCDEQAGANEMAEILATRCSEALRSRDRASGCTALGIAASLNRVKLVSMLIKACRHAALLSSYKPLGLDMLLPPKL